MSAGLLREKALDRWVFAHALVRDALVSGWSISSRARVHGRAFEILRERRPEAVAQQALHADHAGSRYRARPTERQRSVRRRVIPSRQPTPLTEEFKRGSHGGSAMPLCWSHAEYLSLVRSHKDGVCFDRIEPVYQRYAKAKTGSKIEMWTVAHQPQQIGRGKTLRIITDKAAAIHWSFDGWSTANDLVTRDSGFGCWFADLPSDQLPAGASIVFTLLWQAGWEGKDFQVAIAESLSTQKTA